MKAAKILKGAVLLAAVSAVSAVPASAGTIALTERSAYHSDWGQDVNKYLCEYTCPQIYVAEEDREQYPLLDQALQKISAGYLEQMEADFEEELSYAKDLAKENPEMFMTHTSEQLMYIQRADDLAVSMLVKQWIYLGGAHGGTYYGSWNIDPATGEQLKITDAVTDTEAFSALILDGLKEKYPDSDWSEERESLKSENAENWIWTLGYDGITVWFGNYELVSYAEGCQSVLIPFAGNEGIFEKKFFDIPECRGIEIPTNEEYDCDMNGDGTPERIRIDSGYDDYAWTNLRITVDGETTTFEDFWCYEYDTTLVRSGDISALYIETKSDNDYRSLYLYDVSGITPAALDPVDAGRHYEAGDSDRPGGYVRLTSPEDFMLDTRTDMLSSITAFRHYTVGEDGRPAAEEDFYTFSFPRVLTAKQDFTAERVDEDGNPEGDCAVSAGSELTLLRTDDESWTDAVLEDGRIVRLYVTAGVWPRTVDGIDIQELFDGVMFAG